MAGRPVFEFFARLFSIGSSHSGSEQRVEDRLCDHALTRLLYDNVGLRVFELVALRNLSTPSGLPLPPRSRSRRTSHGTQAIREYIKSQG